MVYRNKTRPEIPCSDNILSSLWENRCSAWHFSFFFPAILHFPLHLFKFDFDRLHSKYIDFTINNQQLSPDGTFTKPANSKLLYGTMSLTRAGIVGDSFWDLSKAITIAIRYSAVRRQGQLKQGYGTSLLVLETIFIPVINLSTPKSD